MKRLYSLDNARVIAVFMILLCHFFIFSDMNTGVGRYLGWVGNLIFLLISAILYSAKYNLDATPGIISSGGAEIRL